jgi:hypothetical protein
MDARSTAMQEPFPMPHAGRAARRGAARLVRAALFVNFDHAVNDGYVAAFDLKHDDLPHAK